MPFGDTLEIVELEVRRRRRTVLAVQNLTFSRGVTVVLGPNGAGKSTLLRSIASVARDGRFSVNGHVLSGRSDVRDYHAASGYLPQDWRPLPGYSVLECVEYAAWLKAVPDSSLRSTSLDVLDEVGLSDRARTKARRLSGGEQQRVGLAETVVHEPRFVLLDEPTSGLDPEQRRAFHRLVDRRRARSTILLSTHLIEDAVAIADRIVILAAGKVRFDGPIDEFMAVGDGLQQSFAGESPGERAYHHLVRTDS